ncbi:hypothetical protein K4F52_002531 [Lecanicillium sp. MT-2017a]|nr:hypothetical protein K4F52_002531 [Lecanicillium sp. MT-2017a]
MAVGCGLGGHLVETLNRASGIKDGIPLYLDKSDSLHKFSYGTYRTVWAEQYPQEEILDDLENRTVYSLASMVVQLRFMIYRSENLESEAAKACLYEIGDISAAIDAEYQEILEIAGDLPPGFQSAKRLVLNIRQIVPQYYCTQIQLARAVRKLGLPEKQSTEELIGVVKTMTMQALLHKGNDALLGLARVEMA